MPNIEDSYYFSDDFLNFMNQASARDPYLPEQNSSTDEEDVADQVDETDNDQVNSDYEDLQSQYSSLQSDNESLNQQLEDYRFAQNELIQNDYLLRNTYNQGGNSSTLNMVLGDEVEDLRTKSNKVNLSDVDMTLKGYVGSLSKKFGDKVLVTSGNDQEHAPNSLHYKGEALDLRYFPEVHNYIKNDPLAQQLGISVLNPNHGTAPHTHIQKREFGGGQQPGGLWNTNRQQWVDSVNHANNGYKLGTGVLNSISNGKPYNNSKYKVQ